MLQPKLLEHVGLTSFDSFASVFTEAYPLVELDCVGKYRTQTRLRFHNVPELLNLLSEAWDFVREGTLVSVTTPSLANGGVQVVSVAASPGIRAFSVSVAVCVPI